MGIKSLFGFGQARDKPVDKAADAGYSFLFGRTTSGKPVNERTAMQTTAVYACVLRKQWHLYRFMYMSIRMTAARSWCMIILYIICSMTSRTRR